MDELGTAYWQQLVDLYDDLALGDCVTADGSLYFDFAGTGGAEDVGDAPTGTRPASDRWNELVADGVAAAVAQEPCTTELLDAADDRIGEGVDRFVQRHDDTIAAAQSDWLETAELLDALVSGEIVLTDAAFDERRAWVPEWAISTVVVESAS